MFSTNKDECTCHIVVHAHPEGLAVPEGYIFNVELLAMTRFSLEIKTLQKHSKGNRQSTIGRIRSSS